MTASKSIVKILFPHTYLDRNRCQKLNSYFGRISLYQPDTIHIPPSVREMSDQGLLKIRTPITEKQEELRSMRNAFFQWAELQGKDLGAAAAYHRFSDAGASALQPDSAAEIRSRILQNANQTSPAAEEDPFVRARLFLLVAQDFDLHQETIDSDFARIHRMEAEMQDAISGRSFEPVPPGAGEGGLHDFMAADRLNSWAAMFYRDCLDSGDGDSPFVFVASCRAILDTILEPSAESVRIVALDDMADMDDSSLDAVLSETFRADENTTLPGTLLKDNDIDIDDLDAPFLLVFPGARPLDFFLRYSRFGLEPEAFQPSGTSRIRHTAVLYAP